MGSKESEHNSVRDVVVLLKGMEWQNMGWVIHGKNKGMLVWIV